MRRAQKWADWGPTITRPRRSLVQSGLKPSHSAYCSRCPNVFCIYAETEMSPWLNEIKVPCLVLTGELDGGCNPRLHRQIADALAGSQLVILDGLKHAILIE